MIINDEIFTLGFPIDVESAIFTDEDSNILLDENSDRLADADIISALIELLTFELNIQQYVLSF